MHAGALNVRSIPATYRFRVQPLNCRRCRQGIVSVAKQVHNDLPAVDVSAPWKQSKNLLAIAASCMRLTVNVCVCVVWS